MGDRDGTATDGTNDFVGVGAKTAGINNGTLLKDSVGDAVGKPIGTVGDRVVRIADVMDDFANDTELVVVKAVCWDGFTVGSLDGFDERGVLELGENVGHAVEVVGVLETGADEGL